MNQSTSTPSDSSTESQTAADLTKLGTAANEQLQAHLIRDITRSAELKQLPTEKMRVTSIYSYKLADPNVDKQTEVWYVSYGSEERVYDIELTFLSSGTDYIVKRR